VGGSLASSTHGVYRATEDGDLVAEIHPFHLTRLASALGPSWYAEVPAMESALRAGRAFNLIHIITALKFDIFPATTDFHLAQLERAERRRLRLEGAAPCWVTTVEDILLAKLSWYRDGGEVSERQWRDIVGVASANPAMDQPYLQLWAGRLGVAALLAKAQAAQQSI